MRIHPLKLGHERLTPAKARIIAHLIGDGCACRSGSDYHIKYASNDEALLEQFSKDMCFAYGLRTKRYLERSGKTGKPLPLVHARSKRAFLDLMQYSSFYSREWIVPADIQQGNPEIRRAFLQAFFDDEGTAFLVKGRLMIRAYSINKPGLIAVQRMLSDCRIETRLRSGFGMRRNVYGIEIIDQERFAARIGFSLKRKQDILLAELFFIREEKVPPPRLEPGTPP